VHRAVGGNDHTRGHVADDARQQYGRVDDGQSRRFADAAVAPAEVRPNVVRLVEVTARPVGAVQCRRRVRRRSRRQSSVVFCARILQPREN